jgi:Outer membrane protein
MKLLNKIALAFLLLLAISPAFAQKWSLNDCIDYAIRNNIEIKQQQLLVDNSEVQLALSKTARLPDINAELGQVFTFGRVPAEIQINQNLDLAHTSVSLYTSIPIFTGFKINNEVKRDKLSLQAATEGLKKAKENMELYITSLYLRCLLDKEIINIYQEVIKLTDQQLRQTETLVMAGVVPESQLFDIKSQMAKDELNLVTAENELTLSLLYLAQALNLKNLNGFDILEPVTGEDVILDNMQSLSLTPDQIYDIALGIKPHVREAEYNVDASRTEIAIAKSYYYPTISLGFSISSMYNYIYKNQDISSPFTLGYQAGAQAQIAESYYWPDLDVSASVSGMMNFFSDSRLNNDPFFTQLNDNRNELIALTMKIPIFNWGKTGKKVRQARIKMTDRMLVLDNVKLSLYKEIQEAYTGAVTSRTKYQATEKAVRAAQESYDYAVLRYEVGNMTVFEYNEAQAKLFNSRTEQLLAKYDFMFRAKILDFYKGESLYKTKN